MFMRYLVNPSIPSASSTRAFHRLFVPTQSQTSCHQHICYLRSAFITAIFGPFKYVLQKTGQLLQDNVLNIFLYFKPSENC